MHQPPPQRFILTYCLAGNPKSSVTLDFGEVLIGRGSDCQIIIEDMQASRRHAALSLKPEGISLTDLGSHNGTFLGGKRVPAHTTIPLHPGQPFYIGAVEFCVFERGASTPPQQPEQARTAYPAPSNTPAARRAKISLKWLLLVLLLIIACLLAAAGGLMILWGSQSAQALPLKHAQIVMLACGRQTLPAETPALHRASPSATQIILRGLPAIHTGPFAPKHGVGNLLAGESVINHI